MTTSTDIVPVERTPVTVFGTDEPVGIVARVTAVAGPLADFIKQQHMSTRINDREYVLAEGWSFMGAMLGVAPVTRRVSEVRDPEGALLGFEAQVELVTRDGSIVGGAVAECAWVERNWSDREPFALKSMAQTRATGKAYRMAFGFVMKAAGYEATPAEEMVTERVGPAAPQPRQEPRTSTATSQPGLAGAEVGFANVGRLLTWASTTHKMTRANVLDALGVAGLEDIDLDTARGRIEEVVAGR